MIDRNKKDYSKDSNNQEQNYKEKIQKIFLHNILKVNSMQVVRVLVKTSSKACPPDFQNNVGIWEQYWSTDGEKIFERRINPENIN